MHVSSGPYYFFAIFAMIIFAINNMARKASRKGSKRQSRKGSRKGSRRVSRKVGAQGEPQAVKRDQRAGREGAHPREVRAFQSLFSKVLQSRRVVAQRVGDAEALVLEGQRRVQDRKGAGAENLCASRWLH